MCMGLQTLHDCGFRLSESWSCGIKRRCIDCSCKQRTLMDQVGDRGSSSSMKRRPPNASDASEPKAQLGCRRPDPPPLPPLPSWRCSCCCGGAGGGGSPPAKGLPLSAAAAPGLAISTSRGEPEAVLAAREVLPGQA